MAEETCNSNYTNGPVPQKSNSPKGKKNNKVGSMSKLLKIILAAFSIPEKPIAPLPPFLILTGAALRPGMDPRTVASRIIARQVEAGLIPGDVFADGPNSNEAMELIRLEETINSLQTEAKIEVAVPPGIPITAIGVTTAPGTPVVVQGATTAIMAANGIMR
jgi:hypothetical protein